jgi:hypothetical protein
MPRLALVPRLLTVAALAVLTATLIGCGGGNDAVVDNTGPRPSADNASVSGVVVQADHPDQAVAGAEVTDPFTRQTVRTNSSGAFTLTGLAAGAVDLSISSTRTSDHLSTTLRVPTVAGNTTYVSIALLPTAMGTPTGLIVDPRDPTVEIGTIVPFSASVMVGFDKVNVQPSWIVTNTPGIKVGTIDSSGNFTALAPGSAQVTAAIGSLTETTSVVVTGSTPPLITSVILSHSNSNPISASGGPLTITCAIADADGVNTSIAGTPKGLRIEIYPPDGDVIEVAPGAPVTGSIFDGTWRTVYQVPANSNVPDAWGNQESQSYSLRVVARDLAGAESYSRWYEFKVAGVDVPPPPG